MNQKTSTAEDVVSYIKDNYPSTEKEFQALLNKMYLTFCKKQFDYGPGNIAMGTSLKNEKEVNTALFGIIVRLNDKINRLINLSTNHDRKAKNAPICRMIKSNDANNNHRILVKTVIRSPPGVPVSKRTR